MAIRINHQGIRQRLHRYDPQEGTRTAEWNHSAIHKGHSVPAANDVAALVALAAPMSSAVTPASAQTEQRAPGFLVKLPETEPCSVVLRFA